jgi:1-acylglycerone phosphate reductase
LQPWRTWDRHGKNLPAKGFKVFATIRGVAKAGSLAETESIEILELEVISKKSIARCAKTVEKLTGESLDILINNAGTSGVMPLLDLDLDKAKKAYNANVLELIAMTQAFAPMLIEAKGIVCNTSSVSGELIFSWMGPSCFIPVNYWLCANSDTGNYISVSWSIHFYDQ